MRTTPIPLPSKGVNNRQAETGVPPGQVRDAVNVNIDIEGRLTRRSGYRVLARGRRFHSLIEHEGRILVGVNKTLALVDPDTFEPVPICSLTSATPLAFARHGSRLFATNGHQLIVIDGDRAWDAAGMLPVFDVEPHDTGALPAGEYGVVVAAINPDGTDSPSQFLQIELATSGGIRLVDMPTGHPEYRVYLTPPNGEELRLAETVPAGVQAWLVGTPAAGALNHEVGLAAMPAGEHIASYMGRLYVGTLDQLFMSEPQAPTRYNPATGWMRTPGLRFVAASEAGLVVSDVSGTYLHTDDPRSQTSRVRLLTRSRAAHGSSLIVAGEVFGDSGEWLVWLTEHGFAMLSPGGELQQPQRGTLKVDVTAPATLTLRHENGQTRIIAATHEAANGSNTFKDTTEVE